MSLRDNIIGTIEAKRLFCDLFGIPRRRLAGRPVGSSKKSRFLLKQIPLSLAMAAPSTVAPRTAQLREALK